MRDAQLPRAPCCDDAFGASANACCTADDHLGRDRLSSWHTSTTSLRVAGETRLPLIQLCATAPGVPVSLPIAATFLSDARRPSALSRSRPRRQRVSRCLVPSEVDDRKRALEASPGVHHQNRATDTRVRCSSKAAWALLRKRSSSVATTPFEDGAFASRSGGGRASRPSPSRVASLACSGRCVADRSLLRPCRGKLAASARRHYAVAWSTTLPTRLHWSRRPTKIRRRPAPQDIGGEALDLREPRQLPLRPQSALPFSSTPPGTIDEREVRDEPQPARAVNCVSILRPHPKLRPETRAHSGFSVSAKSQSRESSKRHAQRRPGRARSRQRRPPCSKENRRRETKKKTACQGPPVQSHEPFGT